MGRVYDALKRAAAHDGDAADERTNAAAPAGDNGERHAKANGAHGNGNGSSNGAGHNGAAAEGLHAVAAPDPLFNRQTAYFHAPDANASAHTSASTEHTVQATVGSALPGGASARVAGATVGAVSSPRAVTYPAIEVDTARVEPHLVAIIDPRTPHAEQYRSLRTRVLHAGEKRKVQAVVVTSAGVAEGKTVTALNLAWLLAQTDGVRALLIDGDLRQPCAGHYLALDAPTGLSEVLAGEASLHDSIVRLEPAGLHFLPGGTARNDCAELLAGPKFSATLAELRRTFNYIIIDAPPLGLFSDASVLINRADAALLVVRANKTRYGTLDRVLEPLPRERVLGIVLNSAEAASDSSSYYYQRRYYRRDEAGQATTKEREEAG